MQQDGYFFQRAQAELDMAQRATSPEAVKAHRELADRYLDSFHHPRPDAATTHLEEWIG